MNVTYSETLSQAFVIGPDELKKLVDLLQGRIGKVSISADCIDKIERKFSAVKELIDYENPKSKRICRIYLSARDGFEKSATITFGDFSSFSGGVSLNITAREDVVVRLKDKIWDIVAGTRPWYNPLAGFNFTNITHWVVYFFFIFSGLVLIRFLSFKFGLISDSKDGIEIRSQIWVFILLLSVIFGIVCCIFLTKLSKWLFPSGVFMIGQGKSRFETLKRVRWGVVIPFAVSFAAGCLLLIFK